MFSDRKASELVAKIRAEERERERPRAPSADADDFAGGRDAIEVDIVTAAKLHRWSTASGASAAIIVRDLVLAAEASVGRTTFPEVVTLCGSTRFRDEFLDAHFQLAMEGIVSHLPSLKRVEGADAKTVLDELHLRKIDMADRVHVINVGGYVGESTAREIAYAERAGKPVTYLEPRASGS